MLDLENIVAAVGISLSTSWDINTVSISNFALQIRSPSYNTLINRYQRSSVHRCIAVEIYRTFMSVPEILLEMYLLPVW